MGTIQAPPGVSIPAVLLPLLQAMHGTNRQTQPSLALALTSLFMAKLILVLWVVQSASTSGGQRCAAPREMGGTNDVTVSNIVDLLAVVLHAVYFLLITSALQHT